MANWRRWSDGSAFILFETREAAEIVFDTEIITAKRPNEVQVLVNDLAVCDVKIESTEWRFHKVGPISLRVPRGENVIRFQVREGGSEAADQRMRSVAVRNLSLFSAGGKPVWEVPSLWGQD